MQQHTYTRVWLIAVFLVLQPHAAHSMPGVQSPEPSTALAVFEVASVKPSNVSPEPPALGCRGTDGVIDAGISRISSDATPMGHCVAKRMPFKFLVAFAYGIPVSQAMTAVFGGGDMELERYDIDGKAEQLVKAEQLRLMFRALLAERFKLVVHQQSKEQDVLNLVVGSRGPKLKRSSEDGECVAKPELGPCYRLLGGPPDGMHGQRVPLSEVVSLISGSPGMTSIVHDGTGLTGLFDISTTGWNATDNASAPGYRDDLPALPTVLQEQLGLTFKREKMAVTVLVIDHVEPPVAV